MPRCARKHQLVNSLVYHIFNRSNGKVTIFNCHEDYIYFISLLIKYSEDYRFKIYHWVIMPNHYHLLVEFEDPQEVSKVLAGLNRAYTYYHHHQYAGAGFLWQGRFKSQPIQKEQYLIACARYIERNPVRSGLVCEASQYPYSSAGFYCSGNQDYVTSEDPFFAEFGQCPEEKRAGYISYLKEFNQEEEDSFRSLIPKGSPEFLSRLLLLNGRISPRITGKPRLKNMKNRI